MRFIGDVHGKFRRYREIIRDCPASIQVGDMGVGFRRWPHGEPEANPPHDAMTEGEHRFIRGNHDNPAACTSQSQWIPDGTIKNGIMFIGGAFSIDWMLRHEGYSWWKDEELSQEKLNGLVSEFIIQKPRVMVTHDAPNDIKQLILQRIPIIGGKFNMEPPTRTQKAFQEMWSAHSPELWIFGHYHLSFDQTINGTRFICLAELEYRDIEISENGITVTDGVKPR